MGRSAAPWAPTVSARSAEHRRQKPYLGCARLAHGASCSILQGGGPGRLPEGPSKRDDHEYDRGDLDSEVPEMVGRGSVIKENAEQACEPGTAYSETDQQEALGCARRCPQAPHQEEADADLQPAVERPDLGQGARRGLKPGLLREKSRGRQAPDAGEENEPGQDREQDTLE